MTKKKYHISVVNICQIYAIRYNLRLAHLLEIDTDYEHIPSRVFFYNSHRVKSSLLSLELSFRSLLQGRQTSK